jgi:hypothetical protein
MPRTLHVAILRNAALLVPAPARAEWLAEWRAELWYVEHDATAFCLGSFRDALWLRIKSFDARSALSLDSPLRCVLFLTGSAGLIFLLAGRGAALSSLRFQGPEGFAVGLFWMYFESLLVLLTLNPLVLGEHTPNAHAPSLLIRLRRWLFLAIKMALLPPILFLATAAVAPIFPPAAGILFVGLIFGLRWVLADQRRRCPVCLHFLSNPVELGGYPHMVFHPRGTELSCPRGHGSLYVPRTPTSWWQKQRWQYKRNRAVLW